MKPTALGILRSDVSFDCLRSCGSAADHRHARCAGRHDDNRRQLSSASAPRFGGTINMGGQGQQDTDLAEVSQRVCRLLCNRIAGCTAHPRSHSVQERQFCNVRIISASSPKTDIHRKGRHVPKAKHGHHAAHPMTSSASASSVGGILSAKRGEYCSLRSTRPSNRA